VSYVEVEYQMSERHACRLMGLRRSTHRYRARKVERDAVLRTQLKELAAKRMRFGYRRLTAMLVREGMPANHKRVVPALPRGRVGDADMAETADPLEWRGNKPSSGEAE
jgi:hypothetical protein